MDAVMSDLVQELQDGMAAAHSVLVEEASKRYGLPKVKKLRDEYKAALKSGIELDMSYEAREAMNWMISHEEQIINVVFRATIKLCRQASESNHTMLVFDDYFQESMLSIYDCMYLYNGSTRFVTFVTRVVRNRIIDLARAADRRKRLFHSLNVDDDEMELAAPVEPVDKAIEDQEMWNAVRNAPLTEMEREVVTAHLHGETDYRARKTQEINPRTGQPWTKQWLSQVFVRACEKIRKQYNSGSRRRAA